MDNMGTEIKPVTCATTTDVRAVMRALVLPADNLDWRGKVAVVIQGLAKLPQCECPLKHYFAPGVYIREIFMPAGAIVIGKIHKTEHFNIISKGKVSMVSEDKTELLEGPVTFISKAGVQKVLYIHEDTVWSTVHITDERDLDRLEAQLIEPDDGYPNLKRIVERVGVLLAAKEEGHA